MNDKSDSAHAYIYSLESLEDREFERPIPNATPYAADHEPTPDAIRKYFREHLYPYAKRMSLDQYYAEMHPLQIELVKLQNWVKTTRQKIVIVFEGRDAAGKGSTIRRFTEHLNPRGARVVSLDKPTDAEREQWYFQRYVDHLPTAGEIVFFDRSWYNRAGVERVMGFCTEEEYWEFIAQTPDFERMLVRSGVRLFKLYLSVGRDEQARRFKDRETNPLKKWKLSPVDVEAQARWDDYTHAKEVTFRLTNTSYAPWTVIKSEDKLRARIGAIRYILHMLDYNEKDPVVARAPDPLIAASAALAFELGEPDLQGRKN